MKACKVFVRFAAVLCKRYGRERENQKPVPKNSCPEEIRGQVVRERRLIGLLSSWS